MHKTVPELVDDFVRGSDAAFTELVHRYQRKVYSLAYQVLGNHLDADEVVQETFVRIYRRRKELAEVKFFSTFLLRIASNYAIDVLRKQRGHSRMPEDSSSLPGEVQIDLARQVATPSEEFENRALLEEIKRALRELPPRQQLTAILHDIEGYSKAEIAAMLGCPEATVRSNLHIARSKLRKALKKRLRKGS
ncbi:MAG TPA: RNA polymerase sigma factor [candidate division Zixibacteria bacterium]|nr:RNA polymerase sigma factor [candidate division Zixibacteria bacterium]MDD4917242.1 RNA polymerase sigma factor [candidate division Zixibacteria bacterium]MDM7971708.1 RNA polymerase sigma factor [candidate division Zixibacteria bacterium]HOD65904.1 RNA polymerase sigma factor [candidate division Zixibacteria bacterium]HPM36051.1 RNA polymerase sigma factor [candidate division Zixibacteria bacterium]